MRGKILLRTLCCLFVAIMACGTAWAGPFRAPAYKGPMAPMRVPDSVDALIYSNFAVDACTGCNYSSANGYFVLGATNCFAPGATQWIGYPFVATRTQQVRRVTLAMTDSGFCVASTLKFTCGIYSDACTGAPGTLIGTARTGTAAAAPCAVSNVNFGTTGPTLT